MGIHTFLQKHMKMSSVKRRPDSGPPMKITVAIKQQMGGTK